MNVEENALSGTLGSQYTDYIRLIWKPGTQEWRKGIAERASKREEGKIKMEEGAGLEGANAQRPTPNAQHPIKRSERQIDFALANCSEVKHSITS